MDFINIFKHFKSKKNKALDKEAEKPSFENPKIDEELATGSNELYREMESPEDTPKLSMETTPTPSSEPAPLRAGPK